MPNGYRVSLVDGILDPGDALSGPPAVFFTTDTVIGTGTATFFNATFNGTFFAAGTGSGTYILGTDGHVYFDPFFDDALLTAYSSAEVTTAPAFTGSIFGTSGDDALIAGTSGDDTIYGGDDNDPVGTGADTIDADAGDDVVFGGDGADEITGGFGSDTLDGGAGDDTLIGDGASGPPPTTPVRENLDWTDQGGDGTDIQAGFTQTTGLMDVTVSFSDDGDNTPTFEVSTDAIFALGGEEFDTNSSLDLFGDGDGGTSTTTISFASAVTGVAEDEVENVSFRISDIDFFAGNHEDVITVNAFDADGNAVTVTITPDGNDTVSGNTITAGPSLEDPDDAAGSVLVQIAGPVQEIQIIYSNGLDGTQRVHVSDIFFDAIPLPLSNDSILGGAGNDEIFGNEGADTLEGGIGDDTITGGAGADSLTGDTGDDVLNLGGGDTATGGDGDDLFQIVAGDLDGTGITIVGGEGDESTGDTLDLSGVLVPGSIVYSNTNDTLGGLSGTATLTDGTIVTFSEIETIICFSAGTLIQTPRGERRIETLEKGDVVVTLDNGPQPIRWIGKKTVRATGPLAPIGFAKGVVGNHRELLVSPQHRMLVQGYRAELLFGEPEVLVPAKSLVDDYHVTAHYGGMVTYVHMLFDQHEIVMANGAPSESFYPGESGLETLTDPARDELFQVFPELRTDIGNYGALCRSVVKASDARALVHS